MSYAPTMDSDLLKLMYTMLLQLILKYIKKPWIITYITINITMCMYICLAQNNYSRHWKLITVLSKVTVTQNNFTDIFSFFVVLKQTWHPLWLPYRLSKQNPPSNNSSRWKVRCKLALALLLGLAVDLCNRRAPV